MSTRFTTATGSVYVVDEAASTVTREPGDDTNDLRRDREVVELVAWAGARVGLPVVMLLRLGDGVTQRMTTPVTHVEEVTAS